MDQPERTLTKEGKGEGDGKGRTGRSSDHKKRTRSRSNSRSSSSSSRSSSSAGSRTGKDKAGRKGNRDKSRSKNNKAKKSPQESPYKEGNNLQRPGKEDKAKNDNNKKADNTNNTKKHPKENGVKINSNINNNTTEIYSRPHTSRARLESSPSPGYDNSERNPNRKNLGSSTDQVADLRPIFGPWRAPDPERQRLLVERLAPAKPPAPPDPRFNHWKNHFLYYWHIGSEPKPKREGNYQGSPRRHQHCEVGQTSAHSYNSYDHRLLKRRPKTSSARLGRDYRKNNNNSNNGNSNTNDDGNMRLDLTNNPLTGSASVDGRHGMAQRGTQSAREYSAGECPTVVSGLDRRYMGLQSVSGPEMQEIVDRLTKMTSAYNAKFAPNPHVWVDTEPGAHMVKRSNTTVG